MLSLPTGFLWELAPSFGLAAVAVIAAHCFRRFLIKRMLRWGDFSHRIERLSFFWPWVLGLYVVLTHLPGPPRAVRYIDKVLDLYLYATGTLMAIHLSLWVLQRFLTEQGIVAPVSKTVHKGIYALFVLVGTLLLFLRIDVPVSPFLTVIGIGGLATVLAFQETLSDTAAGYHLLSERRLRIGDRIRLHSGEEGIVQEVL